MNFIDKCLLSVMRTNYPSFDVIVVDDGSTDGSDKFCERMIRDYPNLRVFKSTKNQGAAFAKNEGAKLATGEIVVFLDNDTIVDEQWLMEVINMFDSEDSIEGVQSVILNVDKPDVIQHAGIKIISCIGVGYAILGNTTYNADIKSQEVVPLTTALALKRKIFMQSGGFDVDLFAYTEDIDFGWRWCLSNHKTVLAGRSKVYHPNKSPAERGSITQRSTRSMVENISFHLTKNSIRSILKNSEFSRLLVCIPLAITIYLLMGMRGILTHSPSVFRGVTSGLVWNLQKLDDTLDRRIEVQSSRQMSDSEFSNLHMVSLLKMLRIWLAR